MLCSLPAFEMYRTVAQVVTKKPTGPITKTSSIKRRYELTPRLRGDGSVSKNYRIKIAGNDDR